MHVLLVEDHTDTRTVLEMLLNRCGCRTVTAKTIGDARSRLQGMRFDILLTDLNLPDGDGIDLVREAKQTQELKAIAVTGRTSDDERAEGLRAGFDLYLTKPIDFRQLREALRLRAGADAEDGKNGHSCNAPEVAAASCVAPSATSQTPAAG